MSFRFLVRWFLGASMVAVVALVGWSCGVGGPGTAKDSGVLDSGPDVDAAPPSVRTMEPQTLRYDEIPVERGQKFVDLRPKTDWENGHVPRAIDVPMADLWDGSALVSGGACLLAVAPVLDRRLVLYGTGQDDDQVRALAQAVLGLGYTDVWVLHGGMAAWRSAHFYEDIELDGLRSDHYDPIPAGDRIIDAMSSATYVEGHIPGALNLDANLIWDSGSEQPIDGGQALEDLVGCDISNVIFYCVNAACHASTVSCWVAEGMDCFSQTRILHFAAGTEGWRGAGLPLSCGDQPDGTACP